MSFEDDTQVYQMRRAGPLVSLMRVCLTREHSEPGLSEDYTCRLACPPGIRASCTTGLYRSN